MLSKYYPNLLIYMVPRAGIELTPKLLIFIVIFSLVLITRPCARPSLYSVKRLTPLKRIEGGVIIIAPGRLSPSPNNYSCQPHT